MRCALFLFFLATTAVAQTTHIVDVGVPNNQFTPEFLEIRVGDTVRWVIGDTTSGSGDDARVHVLVKPFAPGLVTNMVIATDRRL